MTPERPTARSLVEAALAEVTTLTVAEAQRFSADGRAFFVDVRESAELARTGRLPGALHIPRGLLEFAFDPASPWHRSACVPTPGQTVVLYCGIGWRSALAAQALQQLGVGPVAHLGGGIEAWLAAGGGTEPADPMPA
jgi:rhodanese-related sulfurtransferase